MIVVFVNFAAACAFCLFSPVRRSSELVDWTHRLIMRSFEADSMLRSTDCWIESEVQVQLASWFAWSSGGVTHEIETR